MAEEFKISEWLQKAKEDPKQGAVPLVGVLAIGFVVWKFLYAPKATQIAKELKKNKGLVSEMKNFKDAANKLEDIKIHIEEMKRNWAETQKLVYKELERTMFLRKVRELATQANINVKSMNPMPDESVTIGPIQAKKFSVNFAYTGELTQILTFMRFVELEPKICYMAIPDLAPNASGTFDTIITVSTVLFPDIIPTNLEEEEGEEDEEEE